MECVRSKIDDQAILAGEIQSLFVTHNEEISYFKTREILLDRLSKLENAWISFYMNHKELKKSSLNDDNNYFKSIFHSIKSLYFEMKSSIERKLIDLGSLENISEEKDLDLTIYEDQSEIPNSPYGQQNPNFSVEGVKSPPALFTSHIVETPFNEYKVEEMSQGVSQNEGLPEKSLVRKDNAVSLELLGYQYPVQRVQSRHSLVQNDNIVLPGLTESQYSSQIERSSEHSLVQKDNGNSEKFSEYKCSEQLMPSGQTLVHYDNVSFGFNKKLSLPSGQSLVHYDNVSFGYVGQSVRSNFNWIKAGYTIDNYNIESFNNSGFLCNPKNTWLSSENPTVVHKSNHSLGHQCPTQIFGMHPGNKLVHKDNAYSLEYLRHQLPSQINWVPPGDQLVHKDNRFSWESSDPHFNQQRKNNINSPLCYSTQKETVFQISCLSRPKKTKLSLGLTSFKKNRSVHQTHSGHQSLFQNSTPETPAAAAFKDYYVNDTIMGVNPLNLVTFNPRDLLLQNEFMKIRTLPNNSRELRSIISQSQKRYKKLNFADRNASSAFDTVWCPLTDNFKYKSNFLSIGRITARKIHLDITSMFDPLGFLAPVVSYAKHIRRRLGCSNTPKNSRLPKDILKDWRTLIQTFPGIEMIKVPRYIDLSPGAEVQLHAFSDASETELAAVVYARILRNDIPSVHLIAVESLMCSITNNTTLPRLKLRAALLSAELMQMIKQIMNLGKIDKFAWTSSREVLAWIARDSSTWSGFVSSRVAKIHELTDKSRWNEIQENPVSWVGQGIRPSHSKKIKQWVTGPSWLRRSESEWPDKEDEHLRAADRIAMEMSSSLVPLTYYEEMEVVEAIVQEMRT